MGGTTLLPPKHHGADLSWLARKRRKKLVLLLLTPL
jgi:hypothetical protein